MVKRVIISGGGTGGHIFPAVAIAHALQRLSPGIELLFVGANGRMEMEKVPAAGYRIIGLDIQGINRRSLLRNLLLPLKLLNSIRKARRIIRDFKPDVAVGVGGYASGPLLIAAGNMNIPYLIQEQNSYAGITNKRLGKKAARICVAFEGMETFFPAHKLLLTGNPIRKDAVDIKDKHFEACELLSLSAHKKTLLVTGGSLGARTLNTAMLAGFARLKEADVQLIWQCGSNYYEALKDHPALKDQEGLKLVPFLHRMELAYAAADVIIARAGAGTIAELCAVGKPAILVPSPNVAEDHQTKNAQALVQKDAALLVGDAAAPAELLSAALELLGDKEKMKSLAEHIHALAVTDADEVIAKEILKLGQS